MTSADKARLTRAPLGLAVFTRWHLRLRDQVVEHSAPKALAGSLMLPLAYGPRRHALGAADRFLRHNPRSPLAHAVYRRALRLARELPVTSAPVTLERSIILKAPDVKSGERGFLLTSFESELAKLAAVEGLRDITSLFDVGFLATWHPFYSRALYHYVARAGRPLLLMPSSRADYELCRRRHSDIVALPFQASSWVNPDFYPPPPVKDIDIVMVANFSRYKRHWHLFRALRDLPRELRVVLVGVPWGGRTREAILAEAGAFGTADRFEIHERVVGDRLARAKVFLALSAKEGSYIAMAEALLSGTPVGCYRDAVIGSKDYINDATGMLFDPKQPLAPQIKTFLERAPSYAPQEWAKANISSTVNGKRLSELLRSLARERREPFSRDIAPFYCRYFDFYYERAADQEALAPAYEQLRADYGVTVTRPRN